MNSKTKKQRQKF